MGGDGKTDMVCLTVSITKFISEFFPQNPHLDEIIVKKSRLQVK